MENAVIKIQNLFLKKKIHSNFTKNTKLFYQLDKYTLDENENEKKFIEIRKILCNKDNINNAQLLLDSVYRYYKIYDNIAPKINSRKFLIAWMIVSLPEFMMQIKKPKEYKNEYPVDIYFICQDLVKYTSNFLKKSSNENLRKFKKIFNVYSNAINYFLARDKHEDVQKLVVEYININKTIDGIKQSKKYDDNQKESCIKVITGTKDKILQHLKKLDSGIDISDLEILSKIYDLVEANMEKALFDILLSDIKTRKLHYFNVLINKIIDKLQIKEDKFNKNQLMQKITYGNLTSEEISDYFNVFISQVQSNEDISEMWSEIKNKYTDIIDCLASMLILIFRSIDA
jgi:hypothetical protein